MGSGSWARVWDPITRLTDIDLLSSMLATSSLIRSRKCLRTQSITKRFGASSLRVPRSCSTCRGKIQVLSCCSLISPSRQEIHCCQIEFKACPFICLSVAKMLGSNNHCPHPECKLHSRISIYDGACGTMILSACVPGHNIILIHSLRKGANIKMRPVLPAIWSRISTLRRITDKLASASN
jgi:hypothetical protein